MRFDPMERLRQICRENRVTLKQIRGSKTDRRFVRARRQFINEAAAHGLTHGQIARFLKKDRSTISHHFRKMNGVRIPADIQRHLLTLVRHAADLLKTIAPEDPRTQEFHEKNEEIQVHFYLKGSSDA